jgi:hypothetical protein
MRRTEAWKPFEVVSVLSSGGALLTKQPDGSWFASGTRPEHDTYIVTARCPAAKSARYASKFCPMTAYQKTDPVADDNGNFHLTEFRAFIAAPDAQESAKPLLFSKATADYDEGPAISAAQAIDGKNDTQWGVHPRYGEPHESRF